MKNDPAFNRLANGSFEDSQALDRMSREMLARTVTGKQLYDFVARCHGTEFTPETLRGAVASFLHGLPVDMAALQLDRLRRSAQPPAIIKAADFNKMPRSCMTCGKVLVCKHRDQGRTCAVEGEYEEWKPVSEDRKGEPREGCVTFYATENTGKSADQLQRLLQDINQHFMSTGTLSVDVAQPEPSQLRPDSDLADLGRSMKDQTEKLGEHWEHERVGVMGLPDCPTQQPLGARSNVREG